MNITPTIRLISLLVSITVSGTSSYSVLLLCRSSLSDEHEEDYGGNNGEQDKDTNDDACDSAASELLAFSSRFSGSTRVEGKCLARQCDRKEGEEETRGNDAHLEEDLDRTFVLV